MLRYTQMEQKYLINDFGPVFGVGWVAYSFRGVIKLIGNQLSITSTASCNQLAQHNPPDVFLNLTAKVMHKNGGLFESKSFDRSRPSGSDPRTVNSKLWLDFGSVNFTLPEPPQGMELQLTGTCMIKYAEGLALPGWGKSANESFLIGTEYAS